MLYRTTTVRLRGGGSDMTNIGGAWGTGALPGTLIYHPFGHGGFTRDRLDANLMKAVEKTIAKNSTAVESILQQWGMCGE